MLNVINHLATGPDNYADRGLKATRSAHYVCALMHMRLLFGAVLCILAWARHEAACAAGEIKLSEINSVIKKHN